MTGAGPRRRRSRRITVNLTSLAAQALDDAARLTGENLTETMTRAVLLYANVRRATAAGGSLYLRGRPGDELERVLLM